MQPTTSSLGETHTDIQSSSMNGIEHVVLLMLENRSLDSLLGWLYEHDTPQHNIPPLRAGERSYEGLQGLNLNSFINSSNVELRQNIVMSWDGILRAGNWGNPSLLKTDKLKRDTIVARLLQYSNQIAAFFQNKSDNEILGMAGAALYLLGHGDRSADDLHKMSIEDHRNTLIVVRNNVTGESVESLQGKNTKQIVEEATNNNKPWRKLIIPPIRGANALNCPNFSPGESFDEVKRQHYGNGTSPTMKGYMDDYVHVLKHDRGCSDEQIIKFGDQIMRSYTPDQLPVLHGLAKHYAVCDMWFSSVPSQTNTNRAFAFCGTSNGLVNNGFLEEGDQAKSIETLVGYKLGDDRFHAKTIFNALSENNTTWKIFFRSGLLQNNIAKLIDIYRGQAGASTLFAIPVSWALSAFVLAGELVAAISLLAKGISDSSLSYMRSLCDSSINSVYSFRLFPEIKKISAAESHCEKFEKFHAAARAGTLPNFSFIEPVWSISPQSTNSTSAANVLYHLGDDYHPPCNLDGGENLVKSIYSSLIANKKTWNKTLFIITFDEPVGSFDHVVPPAAVAPWGNGASPKLEENFGFNRYGGRVPAILVSPLIEKGTVFRSTTATPYDHTSLIATILKWRGLGRLTAEFGARTSNAPSFDNVLTRAEPRTDARNVKFLDDGLKIGDPVRYFDSFCLRNEEGKYLSIFEENWAEGAVLGGAIASQDVALTEFFPTLSADINKATNLYCVNPFNRIDNSIITRHPGEGEVAERSHVKLISLDSGLGSYTVLGVWKDSRDCYYSNDYIDGDNDLKERWTLNKATRDKDSPADRSLRFGQRIVIESKHYPEFFLDKDGKYVKTTRTDAMWTILPVGIH